MTQAKKMSYLPADISVADGYLLHDPSRLSSRQRQCTSRLAMCIQLEQEEYLTNHPEVPAILKLFLSKQLLDNKEQEILKNAANYFNRPIEELNKEIRKIIDMPPDGNFATPDRPQFHFTDENLSNDLKDIIYKHYSKERWNLATSSINTPDTLSSSFISIKSSATTLSTPEPIPTPEPTFSEIMSGTISNIVDKAIFTNVDDYTVHYDTAYVELSKAVEEAMEVPVIKIREDIANLLFRAYRLFEYNINEKEKIAAEIAWEKGMRKKLKKTLRRLNNFIGYESPSTPNSEVSSHESQRLQPRRPCKCHPQWNYNRYPKDRFGIYIPTGDKFSDNNVIVTPIISITASMDSDKKAEPSDEKIDTESL